jgi:multicomponent Na+:H+ antiporter subunit A
MTALIVLQAAVAAVCFVPGRRSARWAFPVAAVAAALSVAWLLHVAPGVLDGNPLVERHPWVLPLNLTLDFRLDGWALLMGLLVFGIGTLVLAYSSTYFPDRDDKGRIAGLLVLFAGAMWGLVCAEGIFTLFLFWELTSVTSYLLIGIEDRSAAARSAATRAFLVTGAGGLALLAGLVLLGSTTGEWTISGLLASPGSGRLVDVALVLVLVGAFAKSAQFPLHFWLPGAMAAPTPVSAYLHSATMVKAGLVLVARFAPVYAEAPPWRPMVVLAGSCSLLIGGVRASRQQDAKLLLAHGTVSQLGLLMILLGLGTPAATYAGVAMLAAHALFKAGLFLGVGVVDHSAGTRDIRRLRGIAPELPVLAGAVLAAAASMAAIPPTFGFVAKEKGLDALLKTGVAGWGALALTAVVAGSVLTVAYTTRLAIGLLGDRSPGSTSGDPVDPDALHRPSPSFLVAPGLLAVLSVLFGVLAGPVGDVLAKVASSLDEQAGAYHLVLWPGLNTALTCSVLSWLLGALLWWTLNRTERDLDPGPGLATTLYDRGYDGLLVGARRLTGVTHSGSLPVYLGIVLVALIGALLGAFASHDRTPLTGLAMANSPQELGLVVLTGLLGLAILTARRRFSAALLLGGSGYGLALVFLVHGAPDLALTQFLVETLLIVLYLVVLARLPERFADPPSWAPAAVRIVLATGVGTTLALFAVAAFNARTSASVGPEFVRLAEGEGGGRNVVNVILVDFRGWDTLGEIAVLAIAAAGVVNLAGVARREIHRRGLFPAAGAPAATSIAASALGAAGRPRSLILRTTARGLFPVLIVMSVFVTFRGHNAPGGGFAGGLIAAIAVALRYLADGPTAVHMLRVRPVMLMGAGLAIAVGTAAFPLLDGGAPMASSIWRLSLPVVGEVKVVSSTLFDLGVWSVVVGSVLAALGSLVDADEGAGEASLAEAIEDPDGPAAASAGRTR